MNLRHCCGISRLAALATIVILSPSASLVVGDPPETPVNVSPPNGASNVPAAANLCVELQDADGDAIDVDFFARELTAPPDESFSVVLLPDTQFYAQMFPKIFTSQTQWIVDNREARNIAFVIHLGDIVQLAYGVSEWINADAAMSLLEDPARTVWPDGIPYGLSVGNHDQAPNDRAGTIDDEGATTENFNAFFGVPRFETKNYFGGHYGSNNDNSYQLFSAGGMDFIVIDLEYDPDDQPLRDAAIAWADQLLGQYPDRRAIINSHSLLCTQPGYPNATQCPETLYAPFSGQGEAIYDSLKDNPNLFLMVCGHASSSSYQPRRVDTFDGNDVHTLLANYQRGEPCPFRCGNGWLRIATFSPVDDEITIETYSPWLGKYWDGVNPEHHSFVLSYDMNQGRQFEKVGTLTGVASGMTACLDWTGRNEGSVYEWYVEASDAEATVDSARWTFSSDGSCVLEPNCDDQDPCTVDTCATTCQHELVANCCEIDADCEDGNPCTDDVCLAGSCSNTFNDHSCYDGSECTTNDVCAGGVCTGTPMSCDDGNACTDDSCVDGSCINQYDPVGICCSDDSHCDDGNYCTADTCEVDGTCTNTVDPTCCNAGIDCDDGDVCTSDLCVQRNVAALRLNELYGHLVVPHFEEAGAGSNHELGDAQPPAMSARRFTLECWFKWSGGGVLAATSGFEWDPRDVGGIEAYPLISKGVVDQEVFPFNPDAAGIKSVNYFLGILGDGHVLTADFEEHPSGEAESANHPVYGTTEILPDQWYHAAVTYDGQCWQLYLNGNPETDGTNCPAQPPAYETQHSFGAGAGQGYISLTEGSFLGLMDEVRVWSEALNADEIAANMHLRIDAAPNLLAHFGFDDTSDDNVFDSSGNGNHGVIVNADYEVSDLVALGEPYCDSRLPGDVGTVYVYRSDPARVRWVETTNGFPYDVVTGRLSRLRLYGTDTGVCLGDDQTLTAYLDYRLPVPGEGFYYLIREDGPCSLGDYGVDSLGTPRTVGTWDCSVGGTVPTPASQLQALE